MLAPHRAALIIALLAAGTTAATAAEKRVYRVDSVIATLANGTVTLQVKGAVQSGGWKHVRLRPARGDARTLVVEFLAQPPAPGGAVIGGLLPVTATAKIKARHGIVAVRAVADANEVTAQILH